MIYMTGISGMDDTIYLPNLKSNVGRDMDPHTIASFGDNPTRVRATTTRLETMTSEQIENGDIEEGVSMVQGLYELDPISTLTEGSSDAV